MNADNFCFIILSQYRINLLDRWPVYEGLWCMYKAYKAISHRSPCCWVVGRGRYAEVLSINNDQHNSTKIPQPFRLLLPGAGGVMIALLPYQVLCVKKYCGSGSFH